MGWVKNSPTSVIARRAPFRWRRTPGGSAEVGHVLISDTSDRAHVWVGMDDHEQYEVVIRTVEDTDADERQRRLTELLAVGIDRWLRALAVDSGADVSVYPHVDREPW